MKISECLVTAVFMLAATGCGKEAGIAPNTMTKMRRDEAVNLAILGRICDVLDCDFGDIMEHKCLNDDKGEV